MKNEIKVFPKQETKTVNYPTFVGFNFKTRDSIAIWLSDDKESCFVKLNIDKKDIIFRARTP